MSEEHQAKRQRIMAKKIGTHDGTFHCDEALACYLLLKTKEFKDADIIRTRDEKILKDLNIIVDVGGVYDPQTHRYDHHQRGFSQTLDDEHKIKLSSAGLVYKHFGREVIANTLGTDEKITEKIFQRAYTTFIEPLDAIDNGVSMYETDMPPLYRVNTDLSSRVAGLNPDWVDSNPQPDEKFKNAMELAGSEFMALINYYGKSWLPAREIVERSLSTRFGENKDIFILERMCPWKAHLFDLEEEQGIQGQIQYVLFTDQSGSWRVQSVPLSEGAFQSRAPLPEPWRGKRDEELSQLTGIEGCIFAHHSGFIGGTKTKEAAIEFAQKALKLNAQTA